MSTAEAITQRLEEPGKLDSLNRLIDHLDLIATTVDAADGFLRRGEVILDNVSEGVQQVKQAGVSPALSETVRRLPQALEHLPALLDLVDRSSALLSSPGVARLLEMLSDPARLKALASLLEHIELIAFSVEALDGFLRRSEVVMDNVAGAVQEVKKAVPNLEGPTRSLAEWAKYLPLLTDILPKVKRLLDSKGFYTLIHSGIFEPATVSVIGQAGDALVESYNRITPDTKPMGIMGLMGASRDPEVMRALTFLTEFGRRFGQKLEHRPHA